MTLAIKLLAALLLPSALVWLSLGFVVWNWSPETWCEWHRAIFVWVSFMLTVPAVGSVGKIA